MRAPLWFLFALALVACESSVDLCGTGAVCGTDGVTYADTCLLEAAGATLDYAGTCAGECRDCGDFECYGTPVIDERGCPTCTCECSVGDCPDGLTCVAGNCIPKDGGLTDGAVPDALPVDASMPDATGCIDDTDCAPGTCDERDGTCIYPCDPSTTADCNDDGRCETRLGTLDDCSSCRDDCRARAPARTIPMCVDGGCAFPCVDGWNRCGGEECDIDTLVNRLHCGFCGNECDDTEVCVSGSCMPCEGRVRCGNSCVDVTNDSMHCGGCGDVCDPAEICRDGGCVPTACLNPDDPSWSCSGDLGGCTCSCGSWSIDVSTLGFVTCGMGLPDITCPAVLGECSERAPSAVACCLD